MELVWDAPPRALLIERKIKRSPLAAARKLADLDAHLASKPDADYERVLRDAYLEAFDRLQRCSHCGRELSATTSLERGVGATCRKRLLQAEARRAAGR